MTIKVDIRALAGLARLEVTDEEVTKLEGELPSIIAFVETIQSAVVTDEAAVAGLRNVMRDDVNPIEGGLHTEDLLAAAPARIDNRIAVKQVISRKDKK